MCTFIYYVVSVFIVTRFDSQSGHPSPQLVIGMLFFLGAAVWLLIDLILVKKMWARGSLTVHAAVIIYIVIKQLAG